jgi:hypothetical protein
MKLNFCSLTPTENKISSFLSALKRSQPRTAKHELRGRFDSRRPPEDLALVERSRLFGAVTENG